MMTFFTVIMKNGTEMRPFNNAFFLLLVIFSQTWASGSRFIEKFDKFPSTYSMQGDVVDRIFDQAPRAIKNVEQNRIYLDSSMVNLSDQGIFLIVDGGETISLTPIFSSENGLYIEGDSFNIFGAWKCVNCGYWNSKFVNTCQNCYTPRDEQ